MMVLNFTPTQNRTKNNLFPHSERFDEGASQIRPGQATLVVALDGSGDCDTLQEAISRIPDSGGSIYIKEGTYIINESISVSISNVHIFGAGKATVLDFNTSGNPNLQFTTANYVTVSDIYFKQTAGNAIIQIDANSFAVFRNLWIDGSSSQGIYINSSGAGFRVQNCLFVNCTGNCLQCDDSEKAIITGNIFKDGSNDGISGASLSDSVVCNNVFDTLGADGIVLTNSGCDANTIMGNVFLSITDDAVAIDDAGATKNIVVGNSMVGSSISDSGTGTISANNAT